MSMVTTQVRAGLAQDAVLDGINEVSGGGAAGHVRLYTGAAPATLNDAETGTLLSTMALVDGTHAAFSPTALTLVATGYTSAGLFASDPSAAATGTIGYWRMYDYLGVAVLQGTVGLVGSGADIEFNTLSVVTANIVALTAFTSQILGIF